ncbi:MAG: hypothetical protein KGL53_15810, partial [Elusimicrobia bacterium]|nr:hypothetical protein [Elusimicrobiota bacterium]
RADAIIPPMGLDKPTRLFDEGKQEQAFALLLKRLRANPRDGTGNRYILAGLYARAGRWAELARLLRRPTYKDWKTSFWSYPRALMLFATKGPDDPSTRRALEAAVSDNALLPAYILGTKPIPDPLPTTGFHSPGEDSEALLLAAPMKDAFERVPGALAWLGASVGR